jgi:hypothetical protein
MGRDMYMRARLPKQGRPLTVIILMYNWDIMELCMLFGFLFVSCCNSSDYHFRVRARWDDKRHKTTIPDSVSILLTLVECSTYLIPAAPRMPKRRAVSFLGIGPLRPAIH